MLHHRILYAPGALVQLLQAITLQGSVNFDLRQPRQSATVHDQVAENPNQPYMLDCSMPLHDVNLCHVKQVEEE